MPKPGLLNADHFLNRLTLDEMVNAEAIDPYNVLQQIFHFAEMDEMKELLENFCKAALSEQYCWKEGSAGNMLYFCEKLECLVEACFLIYNSAKKKSGPGGKKKFTQRKKIGVTMRLSEAEFLNPFLAIDAFFNHDSLPGWKHCLHNWLEAGLSDHSVVESVDPSELFGFYQYMEKLIEAAYWISGNTKTNRSN